MSQVSRHRFEVGSKVVVSFNPFHADATFVLGCVVGFEQGAGAGGLGLVTVRYQRPLDGSTQERPFAPYNLEPGSPEELLARAARHARQAALLRQLAEDRR